MVEGADATKVSDPSSNECNESKESFQESHHVDDDDNNLKVTSEEGQPSEDAEVPLQALFQVILLVINPHAESEDESNESTLFELLQVQVFHIETTVEDLLEQIPRLATKRALRRQSYRGVIGNPMIMKSPATNSNATHGGYLLFPNSVFVHKLLFGAHKVPQSPVSSPSKTSINAINHQSLPEPSSTTIVLVPLPKDVSVSECAEEALTILHDPSVRNLVRIPFERTWQENLVYTLVVVHATVLIMYFVSSFFLSQLSSHGVDTSTWNNIHSPIITDTSDSNFAAPLSPIRQPLPSSLPPAKSPEEFYSQIATDIADTMTKQQQQPSVAYGPLLIGWACQSAVSYYYLSLATQGIGASKNLHFRKALLRKQQLQQQKHHYNHDNPNDTSFSSSNGGGGGGGGGASSSSADGVVIDPAMKLLDSIYDKFHRFGGVGDDNNMNLSYVDLYTLGGGTSLSIEKPIEIAPVLGRKKRIGTRKSDL